MDQIKPGIYEHYKGKHYEVLGLAHHSETEEPLVVYKALYETKYGHESLWVRPYQMFIENVKVKEGSRPRFQYVGERQ